MQKYEKGECKFDKDSCIYNHYVITHNQNKTQDVITHNQKKPQDFRIRPDNLAPPDWPNLNQLTHLRMTSDIQLTIQKLMMKMIPEILNQIQTNISQH